MGHIFDVVIVGAGPAGLGVARALQVAGIENFIVLDRYTVGSSFALWPAETRFITPSFPTNSIGMLDLNSIAPGVSPAFGLQVEHPSGREYASHLLEVALHFQIPIQENMQVLRVSDVGDGFRVDTSDETLRAQHVIWAAGEFQYPKTDGFIGSDLCMHIALVDSFEELSGDQFIVIGGFESGIDAAYHLAAANRNVRLMDRGCPWLATTSDPSVALSPYSLERMREFWFEERVELFANTSIVEVKSVNDGFEVLSQDGQIFHTPQQPLLAGGYRGSHPLISHMFESRNDGFPALNEHDESTVTPGMFLCGPAVRHENLIFCYIYKYRQRFAVVAKAIATSLGLEAEELETYRQWGMYLDDLSCCGEECVC